MTLREVILSCAMACASFSFAQDGIRIDATFTPQLLPQTSYVRSAVPLPDGRVALIEFWKDAQHMFHNEMACLHVDGARDQSFSNLSGALDLYPWNEGAFFSYQNYAGSRINRHHVLNGAVDNGYRTPSMGTPGPYQLGSLYDVEMDGAGRAYVIGDILLTDTLNGYLGPHNIIRVDQQGGLDHSFSPATSGDLRSALPLPDGRVLLAGGQQDYNGIPVSRLFLVNADGSVDMDFHTSFYLAMPQSVLLTSDGSMILSGRFIDHVDPTALDTLYVVKLLPDGTLDPSFNNHLRPYQALSGDHFATVYSIVPWDENHYLISGNFDQVDGFPKRGIAMITTDGLLEADACSWPGPGLMPDNKVSISLALDGNGGVYAYGGFIGFNDGNYTSAATGIVRFVRDLMTNVGNGSEQPRVRLYPTPARSIAWLEWDPQDPLEDAVLCDGAGRTVRTIPIAGMGNITTVDLGGVPSGGYLVRATHRSGIRSIVRSFVMP